MTIPFRCFSFLPRCSSARSHDLGVVFRSSATIPCFQALIPESTFPSYSFSPQMALTRNPFDLELPSSLPLSWLFGEDLRIVIRCFSFPSTCLEPAVRPLLPSRPFDPRDHRHCRLPVKKLTCRSARFPIAPRTRFEFRSGSSFRVRFVATGLLFR